jgi:ectoine hydroxylase-related dioxygenase (phytanoyl-CoA dioxygenase family)
VTDQPTTDAFQRHQEDLERDGYTIVPNVFDPSMADQLRTTLDTLAESLEIRPAANTFEGTSTLRIYNLLALDPIFQDIPVHPFVLPLCESVLDPGLLISSLSSIAIQPGETPQPIHCDDQVIGLPRPHPPVVCNTMWALTDFTEANGATRLVPGSHKADHDPDFTATYETIPAEMDKGSVLIWHGSLWHGGGANATGDTRVGLAMNYCAGFIRQQENQQLGIPADLVATFSPRLQELVGYGLYRGLIGHIDKQVPSRRLLNATADGRLLWDLATPTD